MATNLFGEQDSIGWLKNALGQFGSGLSQQQLDFNKQQSNLDWQFNRPNVSNPYGKVTYTQNPNGGFTQSTTLNKGQQNILSSEDALAYQRAQTLSGILGKASNTNYNLPTLAYKNLPQLNYGNEVAKTTTQNAFKSATGLLDTRFNEKATADDAQLAARGIPVGSELYNKIAMERERARGEAYNEAAYNAIELGQKASEQAFGQSLDARAQAQLEQDALYKAVYDAKTFGIETPIKQAATLSGIVPTSGQVNVPNMGSLPAIGTSGTAIMDSVTSLAKLAQDGKISQAQLEQGYKDLENKLAIANVQAGASIAAARAQAGAMINAAKLNTEAEKWIFNAGLEASGEG